MSISIHFSGKIYKLILLNNTLVENINEPLWQELPATERDNYLQFHREAYKEDLKHTENSLLKFPRWSIISGYYVMHDITKYFLALKLNIKVSSPDIHFKTIEALGHFIQDKELKEKLISLLKEAENAYFDIERLGEKVVPLMLKQAKAERSKSQYYTEDYTKDRKVNAQRATYFLDNFVKPYLKLIEGLM